jgi:hypothetical protein
LAFSISRADVELALGEADPFGVPDGVALIIEPNVAEPVAAGAVGAVTGALAGGLVKVP